MIRPTLPPRLRKGGTIGLFCPAGPIRDQRLLDQGVKVLTGMGFVVKFAGNIKPCDGYLADSDQGRVQALHQLFADDEVQVIMAIRGGFGCMRMLSSMDFDCIARQPKLLVGFSDVTVLLNSLLKSCNVVSLHGPVVNTLGTSCAKSINLFLSMVTGDYPETIKPPRLEILRGGVGRGPLLGGNLTTLVHLMETPADLSWENKVLFLEDTGEALYRIDRMLTQLALAGRLSKLAGLILGTFDLGAEDTLQAMRLQEEIWNRVLELTRETTYPVWANYPLGHLRENYSLPVGMEATLDSSAGLIRLHPDSTSIA